MPAPADTVQRGAEDEVEAGAEDEDEDEDEADDPIFGFFLNREAQRFWWSHRHDARARTTRVNTSLCWQELIARRSTPRSL